MTLIVVCLLGKMCGLQERVPQIHLMCCNGQPDKWYRTVGDQRPLGKQYLLPMSEKMYKTSLLFMKVAQYKESISCKKRGCQIANLLSRLYISSFYILHSMLSLCQVGGICSVSWSFGCSVGPGFGVGLAQLGNVNGVQVPRGCLFRPFLGLTYRFLTETGLY